MLKSWRARQGFSLAHAARMFGIGGVNPGATLARIEAGSRQPDADMIHRIETVTERAVVASDMHNVRLEWLRKNRPEKFSHHEEAEAAE